MGVPHHFLLGVYYRINFIYYVISSCRYLVFSTCQITSKAFVVDITEARPYTLLFFGGNLESSLIGGVVTVDSWIQ